MYTVNRKNINMYFRGGKLLHHFAANRPILRTIMHQILSELAGFSSRDKKIFGKFFLISARKPGHFGCVFRFTVLMAAADLAFFIDQAIRKGAMPRS